MKKYLTEYIISIDNIIKTKKITKEVIEEHLIKISFFQHERLIHLLVTLAYGLITVLGFIIGMTSENIFVIIIPFLLMFFLIPYIYYYFYLENNVQKLYKQYDELRKLK